MMLEDVYLIGAPTTRTKAYLQLMCKNNIKLGKCYIMTYHSEALIGDKDTFQEGKKEVDFFDEKEPILYTLEKFGIDYETISSENINDSVVIDHIKDMPCKYIVYSGYGGQLLGRGLFSLGKKFIHAHAGVLPAYRGSTTVYYSMLQEQCCGASVIFLSEGIDEGSLITYDTFPIPAKDVNIDYIYEPYTRACVLLKALKDYKQSGFFTCVEQEHDTANTYYIIHPVLKHIAILRQE